MWKWHRYSSPTEKVSGWYCPTVRRCGWMPVRCWFIRKILPIPIHERFYLTGQASFSVRKNPEQPFIVKTTYLDVQALGTVFTVEAYPGDSCSMATLEEGSVLVSVRNEDIQPTVLKSLTNSWFTRIRNIP